MRRAAIVSLALLISACTTDITDIVPQDGPSMVEIYNGHLAGTGQNASDDGALAKARRDAQLRSGQTGVKLDPLSYTRDVQNETDNLFPALENPTLVMHVFPHLAGDERLPVPGYSTSFPLFERVEFALPGEVAQPASTKASAKKIRIIDPSGSAAASSAIRSF